MRRVIVLLCILALSLTVAAAAAPTSRSRAKAPPTTGTSPALVDRGRYLARVAGCNDCHTPGYAESGGSVPTEQWLVGDRLGWRGPWGTTYAINLRTYMEGITETQWLSLARAIRSRPPMPWFALRDMTDDDLRGIYQFVRSLGPGGGPAPAYLPPGQEPPPPFVQFPEPPK